MICDLESLKLFQSTCTDEALALETLAGISSSEIKDSDFHRALALWAEELGDVSGALREWNLAHRDDPDDPALLQKLTESYLDLGSPDKALKFACRLTAHDPSSVKYWAQRVSLEKDLRRFEAAADSQKRAYLLTQDVRFQGKVEEEAKEEKGARFDDTFLILLQELFCGREGVHARQWVDEDGRTGYSPIREPLTLQVLRNHLHGNYTLGVYPLRMDNTVHFAALDLDLSHVVVSSCQPGSAGWKEATEALERFAELVQKQAADDGVTLHLADSGYKGRHLWAFFSEPVPAKMARNYLKQLIAPLAMPPMVACEVFPKQNTVPKDGLGNLIKIPLGVHRKTGRRVWFNEPEPNFEDHRAWLQKVVKVDKDTLIAAYRSELDAEVPSPEPSADPTPVMGGPSLGILWEPDYQLENDQDLQRILSHCVTLRALVDGVQESAQMSHDEARVLIHTLGHLATGPLAVNTLLSRCMESDSSLYLKRPLRGNPMSCAKIRSRIPEVTSHLPCDCSFVRSAGLYPTPALHLSSSGHDIPLDHLQFQALLQDFFRAKKELFRLNKLLELHSERLNLWFDQVGEEELETSLGRLRRLVTQEGQVTFELTV